MSKDLLTGYTSYLRARDLSPHTQRAYVRDVEQFERFLSANRIRPRNLSRKDILAYMANTGLCARSRNRHLSSLRSWCRWLEWNHKLKRNPALEMYRARSGTKLPRFLTESEVLALVESIAPVDLLRIRDRALLELLYSTGIRVGEASSVNLCDLDLQRRYLLVKGKGKQERFVPVGETAVSAIRSWCTEAKLEYNGPLFVNYRHTRLSTRSMHRIVADSARKIGLSNVSPHTLRHTCATHLLERGAPLWAIQELLGHSSLSETSLYTHIGISRLKSVYNETHPRA